MKMWKKREWIGILLTILVTIGSVSLGAVDELKQKTQSLFQNHPDILKELTLWKQRAPIEVRREVRIVEDLTRNHWRCDTPAFLVACKRIGAMKAKAKGAVLALMRKLSVLPGQYWQGMHFRKDRVVVNFYPPSLHARGAAEALAEIGEPAVRALVEAGLPHAHAGISAAETLAQIGEPAVEPLLDLFPTKTLRHRLLIAAVLMKINDSRGYSPVLKAFGLDTPDESDARQHFFTYLSGLLKDKAKVEAGAGWALRFVYGHRADAVLTANGLAPSTAESLIQKLRIEKKRHAHHFQLAPKPSGGKRSGVVFRGVIHPTAPWYASARLGLMGADAVEPLIAFVDSNDLAEDQERARHFGVLALGWTRDARAVPALIKAAQSDNRDMRVAAALSLGFFRDKRSTDPLLGLLENGDNLERKAAVWALGWNGDVRVVPALMEGNDLKKGIPAYAAIRALGRLGDPRAVTLFVEKIRKTNRYFWPWTVRALGDMGVPALQSLLNEMNGDYLRRMFVVEALVSIADRRAVPALVKALGDRIRRVRKMAAWGLGEFQAREAVQPLLKALEDKNAAVRRQVIWALGRIGDKRAVVPLEKILRDGKEKSKIMAYVIRALGRIGHPGSHEILVRILDKRKYAKVASMALWEMTSRDFGTDADKWLAWFAGQQQ